MKIVFAGTPEVAVASLNTLVERGHNVVGVVTREDAPLGRKRILTPSPVAVRATELNLPVHKANRLSEATTEWVTNLGVDLGVVVAYGGLLGRDLLDAPNHGWINLHFSQLPQWRGAAPVQRAIMNGEEELGMTVFRLVEALDAGDILATATHSVPLGTTAGEALSALAERGSALLSDAVQALAENPALGTPQQGEATYAHKLAREDGKLDPTQCTRDLIARWAGTTPEPGAFVEFDGQPLKLHKISTWQHPSGASGEVPEAGEVVIVAGHAVLGTADGAVRLITVQPAGKGAMDGAAWLRGRGERAHVS